MIGHVDDIDVLDDKEAQVWKQYIEKGKNVTSHNNRNATDFPGALRQFRRCEVIVGHETCRSFDDADVTPLALFLLHRR